MRLRQLSSPPVHRASGGFAARPLYPPGPAAARRRFAPEFSAARSFSPAAACAAGDFLHRLGRFFLLRRYGDVRPYGFRHLHRRQGFRRRRRFNLRRRRPCPGGCFTSAGACGAAAITTMTAGGGTHGGSALSRQGQSSAAASRCSASTSTRQRRRHGIAGRGERQRRNRHAHSSVSAR